MSGRGTASESVSRKKPPPAKKAKASRAKPSEEELPQRQRARKAALATVGAREERIKTGHTKAEAGAAKKVTKKAIAVKKRAARKLCGALLRDIERQGQKCGHTAGWGTTHPGFGKCKWHSGNAPNSIKAAEKEMVEERMAKESSLYGRKRDIGPHEALIEEVQRTAGHVTWLEEKIRRFQDEDDLTQSTAKDGMKESEWIIMYQNERKMLVAVCNTAIRAGIAERTVRIAEDQGKLIAAMLMKFINDQVLALTPQQMAHAPRLARNLLMELSSGSEPQTERFVGHEVIDVEGVEVEVR